MSKARFDNAPVILPTSDVRSTAAYYRDVFGFTVVEHLEAEEPFAAAYRDSVELVFVQAKAGEFVPNRLRYGAGYDVYLDPDTVEGVDDIHAELAAAGAKIVRGPELVGYGSYEFVVEDIDGRYVGIGRISDRLAFFRGAFD
jgi:catechol 2,3-dioxygenase-like lactoylglutathione lyase family enzyme